MGTYAAGNQKNIYWIASQDTVTLFWEKPEDATEQTFYQIWVDGREMGTCRLTHYKVTGLLPYTDYLIQINRGENPDREDDTIYWDKFMVMTRKKKTILDITQAPYHGIGDGKTMNTAVLQQAINDCGPEEVVYIPAGVFMTGALKLHSHMELYLAEDAVLQGTDCPEDYLPMIPSRFEGIEMMCYSSLLNLGEMDHDGEYVCENVSIRGKGTIASGGQTLALKIIAMGQEKMKEELEQLGDGIKAYEKPETIPGRVRPRLVNISNCQNIWMEDVTFRDGASWNVHMIYSKGIVTNGCHFYSEGVWNGDGWDPDSSRDCAIFDCDFHTGDDAVAIKSGKNPEGNVINRPTKRIRIFDCRIHKGHGFAIGSEISGGVEDVRIWDCDLGHSTYGLEIKATKKRGGYVKQLAVDNCIAPRVMIHSVTYNDDGVGAANPPVFEQCYFHNTWIRGAYWDQEGVLRPCTAIELKGFDEEGYELKHVNFHKIRLGNEEVTLKKSELVTMEYCEDVNFEEVTEIISEQEDATKLE
jgi:polygalacturonase